MKTRSIILIAVGVLLAGLAAIPLVAHYAVHSRMGPERVYELSEQPTVLTEELATAKARETLKRDGLDVALWQEVSGSRDVTPKRVVFMFTNAAASTRFVHVSLDGPRVVCQTSIGK